MEGRELKAGKGWVETKEQGERQRAHREIAAVVAVMDEALRFAE